ncbi:MAG: histidine kinase [Lutibacter sp.]|uniref:sensor histidine kinase n=1 Tax=Lutibacter sp. TaxID=1925666 RepID=UPI0017C82003|nr:sensor histidine kinase [Lutibacter sp.]MBT8317785.1 histidine kinase [Lutibacter sp.]NNJ58643.1 histidine kinase [Lutibacter sp.]
MKNYRAILFLIIISSKLTAQEPIRYTTKQGLPTNHVYDLAEDTNGFMWFATKQGIVKYDGENFKIFTIKDGLPNNDTWKLETDYQGRLWYFSKSAYQGYIKKDSIYKFATNNKEVLTPRFISKTTDNLWFYSNGIKTMKNNQLVNDGFNIEKSKQLSLEIISKYGLTEIEKFSSLVNPQTKEFVILNLIDNQILVYDWDFKFKHTISIPIENKNLLVSAQIIETGLMYNQIAFFTFDTGVLFINFNNKTTQFINYKELIGSEKHKYFKCKSLTHEFQISIPGHLIIFDYQLNVKKKYSFSKELGQYSYQDSSGNVWLTSISKGISLIPNTQLQTNTYFNNLKVQKINAIENNLYAGINNKGFYKLDVRTNKTQSLLEFNIPHSEIYQMKKYDLSNQHLFVTANKSYILKNNALEVLNFVNTKDNLFINGNTSGAKDIVYHNDSYYYITSQGIVKTIKGDEYSKVIVQKSGLKNGAFFSNQLYVGGSDGLFKLAGDSLVRPKLENDLLNVSISFLSAIREQLLIGTDGRGVYLFDDKELIHLNETDGLSIKSILKEEDTLWLATQKGIKKIQLNLKGGTQSNTIDAFYEADGLLQNNTNDIYKQDSLLYVASDLGLVRLNLKSTVYKQQPKLYFKTKNDTLSYKNGARDNIAITFALQNYVNQEHIAFKYRLLPTQKKWTNTQTKTVNFSNLSPKLYTFEVLATDQHNNQIISRQYLNVIPAWWQTTFAKIGFLILLLFLFVRLNKVIIQTIRKKAQEKMLQEKRVAGLELQALRSQMNPHFVHNSLNAIQYFIQRNEVELSENYLSKFSQLIRLFFEYSRRQTVTIKEELDLLTSYLEMEKLRFEEKLNYVISVCDKIDVDDQLIPSMLLQPIIENAVNHGIFHKMENGLIKVSFKQHYHDTFQVIIEDDGIGINKAKAIFKASSKNYKSNSSAVLQERLDLLNQSKEWNIKYEIKDRSKIENKETGTIVTLTFKQIH